MALIIRQIVEYMCSEKGLAKEECMLLMHAYSDLIDNKEMRLAEIEKHITPAEQFVAGVCEAYKNFYSHDDIDCYNYEEICKAVRRMAKFKNNT